MKTRIIYCMIAVLLFSCDEADEEHISAGFISTGFGILVSDEQGEDLLDPANENSYKADSIDIYWLIDGIKTRKYEANTEIPEFFVIRHNSYHDIYEMTLFLNSKIDENNRTITYVKWNSSEEDKFECEFEFLEVNYFMRKLWFNDSLIWDWDNLDYLHYSYEIVR
ncbi:MAG: hypothetical protein PF485_05160 [Bacteroidales bacterium]|jgi:hypothetical protein|nr:hypothetical protein [Bacteroidales bacterium]